MLSTNFFSCNFHLPQKNHWTYAFSKNLCKTFFITRKQTKPRAVSKNRLVLITTEQALNAPAKKKIAQHNFSPEIKLNALLCVWSLEKKPTSHRHSLFDRDTNEKLSWESWFFAFFPATGAMQFSNYTTFRTPFEMVSRIHFSHLTAGRAGGWISNESFFNLTLNFSSSLKAI